MTIWDFAHEHWFVFVALAFVAIVAAASVAFAVLTTLIVNLRLAIRGYPPVESDTDDDDE